VSGVPSAFVEGTLQEIDSDAACASIAQTTSRIEMRSAVRKIRARR
jgi:hypothetical protein